MMRRPSLHHRCRLRVQRPLPVRLLLPLPVRLLLPLPVNIRFLINEVEGAAFVNIDGVVSFVKWLDDELSRLVDEHAVLKHFEWPEQKADALREAAFGYRDLKKLKGEASSFRDDPRQPCAAALKKMQVLFEKLEHGVYDLARVRDGATGRYGRFQIPSEWMRDAGIVSQVEGAAFVNIDGVVSFVKWLDDELSRLVDEHAVLKHFEWPEQKADALREAAFGYRDLKKLKGEASSFRDDPRQPCAAALKKMQALFEKLEHGVYDLARVRDGATGRYGRFQIPSEWMRDAGIVSQIAEQLRGGVFLYNGKLLRIGYLCVYATMGLMG
ncbi:hypothetical protein ZWY2020_005622 [Hordeum vulgare]|nr:hypothetical protein ZWY2020_005622 [Hordeum vulgare]